MHACGSVSKWLLVEHRCVTPEEVSKVLLECTEWSSDTRLDSNLIGDEIGNLTNLNGDEKAEADLSLTEAITLRFEPFILAVECDSLEHAGTLVHVAVQAGFRESGLAFGTHFPPSKIIASIRCSIKLEVPVAHRNNRDNLLSPAYLEYLVSLANAKFNTNAARTTRLFATLRNHPLFLDAKLRLCPSPPVHSATSSSSFTAVATISAARIEETDSVRLELRPGTIGDDEKQRSVSKPGGALVEQAFQGSDLVEFKPARVKISSPEYAGVWCILTPRAYTKAVKDGLKARLWLSKEWHIWLPAQEEVKLTGLLSASPPAPPQPTDPPSFVLTMVTR